MDKDYYNSLIVKFFVDELTDGERQELMEWVMQSSENHDQFKSYEKIFDQSALYKRNYDAEKAWSRIEEKLAVPLPHAKKKSFSLLLAACFLLFLFFPFYLNKHAVIETFDSVKLEMRQYVNQYGRKAVIYLPDSSRVTLNGGSILFFPEKFSGNKRQVILQGEGFFEVKRNPSKPFEVLSKGIVTRVLGTSFNVKAYDEDQELSVAVLTGKVRVETSSINPAGRKTLADLTKGRALVYNSEEDALTLRTNAENLAAWVSGRFVFDNASLEEIVKELGRTYNISAVFENEKIKHKRYSANFKKQVSLDELMYTLASSDPFKYIIEGSKITFKK